jgi:hypothetical protein
MRVKQCLFCHKDFIASKKTTKYCCRSCQSSHLAQLHGKEKGLKRRKGALLVCQNCKQDYYVPAYRKNISKFCSRSCLALGHPELGEKARANSPLMKRAGKSEPKKYVVITKDGKQVREHRYVMEQFLGRKLTKNEHVHHINGNPRDNRIENLQVLTNSEHQKLELSLFSASLCEPVTNQLRPPASDS